MICIPIVAPNSNGALKDIKNASRIADIIELRLDFIKNINKKKLKKLLSNSVKKVIVTDRKKRKDLIKEAIKLESDFVVYNDKKTNAVYKDLDELVKHVESN